MTSLTQLLVQVCRHSRPGRGRHQPAWAESYRPGLAEQDKETNVAAASGTIGECAPV